MRVPPALLLAGSLAAQTVPSAPRVLLEARAVQPGELAVVTMTTAAPLAAVRARAFGHDLAPFAVDARTWRVMVGIDLDVKPGVYTVTIDGEAAGAPVHATQRLTVRAKQFPTRHLTVDEAFVNPPSDVQPRIAAEAKELDAFYAAAAGPRLWRGAFIPPVPQPANSAFGTRSVFNNQPRSPHAGADFPAPAGTPILCPNGGRVLLAKDLYYTGNTVVVDHGSGLISLFAHMSRLDVTAGEAVAAGQTLGLVGATGRVTGPHLHWALHVNGARVDPMSLMEVLGEKKAPGQGARVPGSEGAKVR